jgi:hypothetical protein
VAELHPLPELRRSARELVERFRHLPPVDLERLRSDVDAIIDQSL